jgi:thiamine transport system permease protein
LRSADIEKKLDALSRNKRLRYTVYAVAIIIFVSLILLPPILGIAVKWDSIPYILSQPQITGEALTAIQNSFIIALAVAALDIIAAVPMAWLIARRKSRWINILDTLADIPFIVPTAVLGGSLLLFWSSPTQGISTLFQGPLINKGWLLVLLLHFTFSYPIVVRVIVGALLDYKKEYENASRTLGAPPLMASRTVTFPILKPSMIAAFILTFSRSISETGATFVVAGAFENGSVFIQNIKTQFASSNPNLYYGATVFASLLLIVISVVIFIGIRLAGPKLKLPVKRFYPSFERKLSYRKAEHSRDTITLVVFLAIVLVPSLFIALPALEALTTPTFNNAMTGTGIWSQYWESILVSYFLAAAVTLLNVLIGLPVAVAIARRKLGTFPTAALDILVNIPLIVPSVALGASMTIFWSQTFTFIPELVLLIFAHMAITYPYFVRSMSAAVERIGIELEEASRTLGAKPLGVFRTIIFPLTKYSLLSGAILMFTRSLSETGATTAVISATSSLKTAPVVLVNWLNTWMKNPNNQAFTLSDIALGSGVLILLSFIMLLVLRLVVKGRGRY